MSAERTTEVEETDEPDHIRVGIADYGVATDGAVLATSGLGSCVGIALVDEEAGVRGLVHAMLPAADGDDEGPKYVDSGIEELVAAMERAGADPSNIQARMAGGSRMLDLSGESIGDRNVEAARSALAARDIPIVGEDVGGEEGRSLRVDPESGGLVITGANASDRRI